MDYALGDRARYFGVARLSIDGGEMRLNGLGVIIVLLSAVAYALYIVPSINRGYMICRDENLRSMYLSSVPLYFS